MFREFREFLIGDCCRLNVNFNLEAGTLRLVVWYRSTPAGEWELCDGSRFQCDHATKLLRALNELTAIDENVE